MGLIAQAHYRFYGSGRRHCESYTCELVLKRRQDLWAVLWYMFNPIRFQHALRLSLDRRWRSESSAEADAPFACSDVMRITVTMSEADMEPFVFAVVPRRLEKSFRNDHRDVVPAYSLVCKPTGRCARTHCPVVRLRACVVAAAA
jgi:hypothetical protein